MSSSETGESPGGASATAALSRRSLLGAAVGCFVGMLPGCGRGNDPGDLETSPLDAVDVESCERLLALDFEAEERHQILARMDEQLDAIRAIRGVDFDNTQAPALVFDPRLPGRLYPEQTGGVTGLGTDCGGPPASDEQIAFAPVFQQACWLREGWITASELTELYLQRIETHDPSLHAYITVTAQKARIQAERADRDFAAGIDRGPLQGIAYGVKDLVDTAGIRTTWGATPYRDRVPDTNAEVIDRLEAAGAVLLGKTSSGALAYGDQWFDAQTRNPWNPEEGASGSSAGSAAAVAAGLCGFAIGTETVGSIVTPASRCGTAGLRPSFGRVPRTGTMALCWSLDKLGPLTRRAADTALVLEALNGNHEGDPSSLEHGFSWDARSQARGMRVGYIPAWFEAAAEPDRRALEALGDLGVECVEITFPDWPYQSLFKVVEIEAAAAFQELTLSNRDDSLVWQADRAWPNTWRRAHFYSAVDFVQLDRFRRRVMDMMEETMAGLDAIISPNYGDPLLLMTTFTGAPCLTLRAGFVERPPRRMSGAPKEGADAQALASVPENVMLWAPLFEERKLLTLATALETALGAWQLRPPLSA